MAPADDAEPRLIDVRQRLQIIDRAHDVVDLVAAVVDRLIERFAVAGAPAIIGRDDHVPAVHRFLDEREHRLRLVAVDATVHPDERRVPLRPAPLQRLEDVGRDVQIADAAAVFHLLEIDDAVARCCESRVGPGLRVDLGLVVWLRVIVGIVADVEPLRAFRVHRNGRGSLPAALRLRCSLRRRRRLLRLTGCRKRAQQEHGSNQDALSSHEDLTRALKR